jgi:hypothetical protein
MSFFRPLPFSVLIRKGACAMLASITRCAIVLSTILALAGCRSGGTSFSPWPWGRKNGVGSSSGAGGPGPQLPSASTAPPAYGSTTPPAVTPGYPDQSGAGPYQPASYPGQPAGYNNPTPTTGMPNAATSGGYGIPNSAGAYGAPVAAPQNGPYNENYSQAQAAPQTAYGAPGGNPGGYQAPTTQSNVYQPPGVPAQSNPAQYPAYPPGGADPYTNSAPSSGSFPPPADNNRAAGPPSGNAYGNGAADSNTGSSFPTADSRNANDRYSTDSAQPEQATADRYAVTTNETATQQTPGGSQNAQPTERYQPGQSAYNPGQSSYNPGQTGYSPPGVPPYQMPTQPNVIPPRRDPYYRPGGTSDYGSPGGSSASATTPTDRYPASPSTSPGAVDPYAPPPAGNYQSPTSPRVP